MSEKKTFFISRAGADKRWAELIASVVRDAGHLAIHEDQDFVEGTSISHNIMLAAESDCTIAVLSPQYFESKYCLAELHAALAADPLGTDGLILPVLVAPCELPRLLGHLAYVDLRGSKDDAARERLMASLVKHGKLGVTKPALAGRTRRVVEQANRNRSAMIEKVRTIWITGFLQQSLFHETRILLGLSERPDAVARPMDLLVKRPDVVERPLPPGIQVVDVFDSVDRSLLILGAPGSGKTTLLLELARDLLDRATDDPTHPIPVVFPLSTWAETRKPIVEWLQDELSLRYDVPRAVGTEWVATDEILPLLDGLDEVKAEHRVACVEAINAFRQDRGFLSLVVASRLADYEVLVEPLRLHGAILVLPLTASQVNAYLTGLGPAGEPVRAVLREDPAMWELLDSPLLLNVITVACASRAAFPVSISSSVVQRRDNLFRLYVKEMLSRRATVSNYTPERTVSLLTWLADQMVNHGQTVFSLERMQLDWLPKHQRNTIRRHNVLIFVLVGELVGAGVGIGRLSGVFQAPALGLFAGLAAALRRGPYPDQEISCIDTIRWSWSRISSPVLIYLICLYAVPLAIASAQLRGEAAVVAWTILSILILVPFLSWLSEALS
jgi:TIR domain/NACHT domain